MFQRYHDLLQICPREEPISFKIGQLAKFPLPIPTSFDLNMVKKLKDHKDGYKLIVGRYNDVDRFMLKPPDRDPLMPSSQERRVYVSINGKTTTFNVANLLASSILGRDVTDAGFGAIIDVCGIWVEDASARRGLIDRLHLQIISKSRVDLTNVTRMKTSDIDVTGRGYFVEAGILKNSSGAHVNIKEDGFVKLIDRRGKSKSCNIGSVMFTAYRDLYSFDSRFHVEVDHIDGDSTNNVPWNFRPVTPHQNRMVSHRTGERTLRPCVTSSHEIFKRTFGNLSSTMLERFINTGSLRRYEMTSYWVHNLGIVLIRGRGGDFKISSAFLSRNGYVTTGGECVHIMVMKAFGKYEEGKMVMHLNDDKQDNRLVNLQMGSSMDNAWRKNTVTVHIRGSMPQKFESEMEACRATGIGNNTIRYNRKRQRCGEPPVYSRTRDGIEFAVYES
jgi:hypothetical protein